ncbi:uncharacterized protein TNCV_4568481 [Trichonephila clavipes]|nr:uncharacterized protein TNCV_4568481 [Trichonephila clavipes]
MEIGTDSGSLRDESSGLDRVQRRSNESQDGKKKGRKRTKQDTVAVSRYNLSPRGGREVESRPAIERKTQQGVPIRSRKGKGRNDIPYIAERTSSSNRNTRRGDDQQRQDQESKGACTRRSLSLEVLVGNEVVSFFFYILSNQWSEELLQ